MTTILPQDISYDSGEMPTYSPVSSMDYIQLDASSFVHIYNGAVVSDMIVFYYGDGACNAVPLPAGGEYIVGPYGAPTFITVTHTQTAGVVMAVLTPYTQYAGPFCVDTAVDGMFRDSVKIINNLNFEMHMQTVDVTPFNAYTNGNPICKYLPTEGGFDFEKLPGYTSRKQSLGWMTFTVSGFFDYYNDTTGQKLILDNAVNGSPLAGQVALTVPGGFSSTLCYITAGMVVTDFTITTSVEGAVLFSFDAVSTGEILFV
jgi:hypothetical protein